MRDGDLVIFSRQPLEVNIRMKPKYTDCLAMQVQMKRFCQIGQTYLATYLARECTRISLKQMRLGQLRGRSDYRVWRLANT
jgi:hypothetical protein